MNHGVILSGIASFLFCALLYAQTLPERVADNKDRIEELEERIDSVERATLVDRVKLSMDVRITLNNYLYREQSKQETVDLGLLRKDGETWGAWNMRGRLKLRADLTDTLKLTGWLSMYKQFIESAPGRYENKLVTPIYDMSRGYYPGNSMIYMERLFIDWFITEWLSFSIGRAPSVDGSPNDLRYNNVPLSTFFESQINAPADGLFATFDFSKMAGIDTLLFRIFYIPEMHLDDTVTNNLFVGPSGGLVSTFGVQVLTSVPGAQQGIFNFNFGVQPKINPGKLMADIDADGTEETLYVPKSSGSFYHAYAGLVMPQFLNGPIDFFISVASTLIVPEVRTSDNPNNGFIGTPVDPVTGRSTPILSIYGGDMSGDLFWGYQLYAGLRYSLPVELFGDKLKIGADANYGNDYFFNYFAPDTTGLNRFSVHGFHTEAYVMVPIHRKAHVRFAYIFERHLSPWSEFYPVGSGVPEIDEQIHNFNVMLNVYF